MSSLMDSHVQSRLSEDDQEEALQHAEYAEYAEYDGISSQAHSTHSNASEAGSSAASQADATVHPEPQQDAAVLSEAQHSAEARQQMLSRLHANPSADAQLQQSAGQHVPEQKHWGNSQLSTQADHSPEAAHAAVPADAQPLQLQAASLRRLSWPGSPAFLETGAYLQQQQPEPRLEQQADQEAEHGSLQAPYSLNKLHTLQVQAHDAAALHSQLLCYVSRLHSGYCHCA